jgi:methionyl-tRNA formyltransferase
MKKPSKPKSSATSLVFFGTGPVAAASLHGLLDAGFEIETVITKPKPAHHRGETPVLELAKREKLLIYTAGSKDELLKIFDEHGFSSLVGLVVDYGVLIPQEVIDYFPKGIINSHFSLLPQWRGADPITFALLSGQDKTGVSLMLIEPELDTGKLIAQAHYDIEPDETNITLTKSLVELSNKTLAEILPLYLAGQIVPTNQNQLEEPTYSRRLTKEDGVVKWDKPAEVIEREVRAYLGWPRSRAEIFGYPVIITRSRVGENAKDGALIVECQPGWLEVLELIGPSGRTMSGEDFIRGYKKTKAKT